MDTIDLADALEVFARRNVSITASLTALGKVAERCTFSRQFGNAWAQTAAPLVTCQRSRTSWHLPAIRSEGIKMPTRIVRRRSATWTHGKQPVSAFAADKL